MAGRILVFAVNLDVNGAVELQLVSEKATKVSQCRAPPELSIYVTTASEADLRPACCLVC